MPRAEGKAWVWYAMDFSESEGKMEQLAIRFRDADTAAKFKLVFEDSKLKMVSKKSLETDLATNLSSPGNLHTASKNFTDSEGTDFQHLTVFLIIYTFCWLSKKKQI